MWKFASNVYASSRVIYDKASDYASYYLYLGDHNNDTDDTNNIIVEGINDNKMETDKLNDYNEFLQVEKYVSEENNKRILPEVGIMHEYSVFFGQPTHIIDNIYLGSAFNAASYDTLKENNITTILNITREIRNYYPDDYQYIRYDLYDNNKHSIQAYLEKAFAAIRFQQDNVDGNASVVLYYLMKTKKNDDGDFMSFDEALNFIKSKRSNVNPTFRFTKDLAKSIIN
jgi:hypothetical protein